MTTCPACRREQVQSSAFCAYCGAVLDRPADGDASAAPAPPPASPTSGSAASSGIAEQPISRRNSASAPASDIGDVGTYFVRRLLALVVDVAFVGTLIAVSARAWMTRTAPDAALSAPQFLELLWLTIAGFFLYRWVFEGLTGTTLGKLVFGLAVRCHDGSGIGLGRAFVRNLLLPLDAAIVGFLTAAVTPRRRRIGDLLAGTVVVNSRMGVAAPVLGIVLLAGAAYAVHIYAGGLYAAGRLAHDAAQLGPALLSGASPQPMPSPTASPSPSPGYVGG